LCEKRTMKAAEIVLRRGRKGMRGEWWRGESSPSTL
jgi:hypothetical protein